MTRGDAPRLVKEALASMKSDIKAAVAKLEAAYAIVRTEDAHEDTAAVAELLARGWERRRSPAKALHYASRATRIAPARRVAWTTLAKTCELVASRTPSDRKSRRAHALYRVAASAFKRAAALTTDPEDKRWLLELASDAEQQAKPAEAP